MSRRHRVAIAHDYLTQRGGAERALLSVCRAFPEAPIYTTLYHPEGTYPEFREKTIFTSPLNRINLFRRHHRLALPVLAPISSKLHVDADITIVSTSGWAHGFDMTGKRMVWCLSPARWVYYPEDYLGRPLWSSPTGWALAALRPVLRRWDQRKQSIADVYFANSTNAKARAESCYPGRTVKVLYPAVDIRSAEPQSRPAALNDWGPGFYLIVARLLPYKNVDKVIEAVRGTSDRLVVIGAGPQKAALRAAAPANVRLLSDLSDAEVRWAYAHCRALVAPSIEDFGLTPLEAAAFGKPTLALRAGGYLDTVREDVTGAFFEEPTPSLIRAAIVASENRVWDGPAITHHAEAFSEPEFVTRLREEVTAMLVQDSAA